VVRESQQIGQSNTAFQFTQLLLNVLGSIIYNNPLACTKVRETDLIDSLVEGLGWRYVNSSTSSYNINIASSNNNDNLATSQQEFGCQLLSLRLLCECMYPLRDHFHQYESTLIIETVKETLEMLRE
jgi:hypothetical protein